MPSISPDLGGISYYSLQWDCELVSCIGGQGLVAMAHGHHMECSGRAVITGDTCHKGVLYMPVLHPTISPPFNFISFKAGKLLLATPKHAFITNSYPKLLNHTLTSQMGRRICCWRASRPRRSGRRSLRKGARRGRG